VKFPVIWIFLLLSLTSAVTTFPDYPIKRARECPVSAENIGVVVGLEPVESSQAQEIYFHVELAKKGFVPVFLVIENGTSTNSFIIDKTMVTYGISDFTISTPLTESGAGKAIALSAIPFVGPFAGAKIISGASQIQQNLMKKEIQSTTLSPGASVHGFLYVPIPRKNPRGKITLRVPISKAGTNEHFDLNLVF
jgi:hypothetical protein